LDSAKTVLKIASLVRVLVAEVSVELVKGVGTFSTSPFPGGWCQDTSRALGHLLADQNERGFELVCGNRSDDDWKTHVWLERDSLIVDITADQFKESGCPGVMFITDRTWHDGWVQNPQELDEVLPGHADAAIYYAISDHPDWQMLLNAGPTSK
jgi:hypothetical protein